MSRSRNNNSIPNMRGRKQVMKTKRLSSKKVRRISVYEDENLKYLRTALVIDK